MGHYERDIFMGYLVGFFNGIFLMEQHGNSPPTNIVLHIEYFVLYVMRVYHVGGCMIR